MPSSLAIGFLVFPDIQQLDLTGPYEMFSVLDVPKEVLLVGKTRDVVTSTTGITFSPTCTLADCPRLDVLCVPGGIGVDALLDDQDVLAFLRRQAETLTFLTAVCTGSLVLGAAGLLRGKRATSHWSAVDLLSRFGAIPTAGRVVRDGHLITAGGVTAGIDFALTVIAELLGRDAAEACQLRLEYAPAPPFEAGSPDSAPAALVLRLRATGQSSRLRREAIIDRVTASWSVSDRF